MNVALELVQMHLKPRHLLKLMCTNSEVYSLLKSNTHYWTRVAAHVVWRDYIVGNRWPDMDLSPYALEDRKRRNCAAGVEIESLYHMSSTTRPYIECMDIFENLIRRAVNPDDDMFAARRLCYNFDPAAPLAALVRAMLYTHIVHHMYIGTEAETLSMRDIARIEIQSTKRGPADIFGVLNELEDAPAVPSKLKFKISMLLQSIIELY